MRDERTIGQRLAALMNLRKFSQRALGKRSGVTQQTISSTLADATVPRLNTAAALARALGASLDWLAGLPSQPGREALGPEEQELIEAFAKLSETHRSAVLNMVRELAGTE